MDTYRNHYGAELRCKHSPFSFCVCAVIFVVDIVISSFSLLVIYLSRCFLHKLNALPSCHRYYAEYDFYYYFVKLPHSLKEAQISHFFLAPPHKRSQCAVCTFLRYHPVGFVAAS